MTVFGDGRSMEHEKVPEMSSMVGFSSGIVLVLLQKGWAAIHIFQVSTRSL